MQAASARLGERRPETHEGWLAALTSLEEMTIGHARAPLALLAAAAGFLLLLACFNVANLLLARTAARWRDSALRVALGANGSRLFLQACAENLTLAIVGGAAGSLAAHWSLPALVPMFPEFVARFDQVEAGSVAWAVAFALAAGAALAVAIVPSIWSSRIDPARALQSGEGSAGGTRRIGRWLAAPQLAVSAMLLTGAFLSIRTVSKMLESDLGFDSRNVLTARLSPPKQLYPSWDSVRMFHGRALEQVASIPGVEAAALVMTLPFSGRSTQFEIRSTEMTRAVAERNVVTAGYFDVMRLRFRRGRVFRDSSEPEAVVTSELAHALWPGADAIGKQVMVAGDLLTVCGVVDGEKQLSLSARAPAKIYLSYGSVNDRGAQSLMSILTFIVARTGAGAALLPAQLTSAIHRTDKAAPVTEVAAMKRLVADSIAVQRLTALLLSALGGIALVVAAAGLHGIAAYSAARGRRETGVRLALGATRLRILLGSLGEWLVIASAGGLAGVLAAIALTMLLRARVPDLVDLDPVAFGGGLLVLIAVSLVACLGPVIRAARADPLAAIRHE